MDWRVLTRRLRSLLMRLVGCRSPRAWLLQLVPLGLFVAFLISTGPYLQESIFRVLMTGDAPSIYAAVYQQGMVKFPSVSDWFENALYPPFLLIGFATAHVALLRKRLLSVLAAFGLWTAALLSILDVVMKLLRPSDVPNLVESVAANLFGGALVAIAVGLVLPLYERLPRAFPELGKAAPAVAGAATLLVGVGLCAAVFVLLTFMFQPTQVQFSTVMEPPISAFAAAPAKGKKEVLNFMPDDGTKTELSAQVFKGSLQLAWSAAAKSNGYTVTASLLSTCGRSELNRLPRLGPIATWTGVHRVSLELDEGAATFDYGADGPVVYRFERRGPSFLWLGKADKGSYRPAYFITEKDILSATTPDKAQVLVQAPLMRVKGRKSYVHPRKLSFVVDGKVATVTLALAEPTRRAARCSPIPVSADLLMGGQTAVRFPTPGVTLLLTFTPVGGGEAAYDAEASKLTISNGSGWAAIGPVSADDLTRSDLGSTDFVGLTGRSVALVLDDKSSVVSPSSRLMAFGDLYGTVNDDGQVKIAGRADMLWRDGTRLSPTRWERLPGELKIALISALAALVALLFKAVWWPNLKELRDEDVRAWM